jgi:branched-subunit amino acid aminotransferase/4-amino-4-deoxychorismate lyase
MTAELDGVPVTPEELEALALTAYGHFTSMRVDNGAVRGLDLHLARLARDAKALFGAELDTEHVRDLARRFAPETSAGMVRVTVFDPTITLGSPEEATQPRVLVTSRPAGSLELSPFQVRTSVYERDLPSVKSTGLFATLAHRRAARLAGYDDVLFTAPDGVVSEGATWNIGFFDGRDVVWPGAEVLEGVTMELLAGAGYDQRRTVHVSDLANFPVAFATSSGIGVRAITKIDDYTFDSDHPVIADLRQAYSEIGEQVL